MDENNLIQRLRGRAAYLRNKGEEKSPGLMEDAAYELERLQRMNAPKPRTLGTILRDCRTADSRDNPHPIPIPPADFKKRMETWTKVIQGGKKTADDIIAALATKRWAPSKEQEAEIRAIKKGEQQ